jgi:upstream activation factor subunit UAF30
LDNLEIQTKHEGQISRTEKQPSLKTQTSMWGPSLSDFQFLTINEKNLQKLSLSQKKERKMVSDSELTERLKEFLRNADLDKTTTGTVRRKLEEDFAIDLSDKKVFIREQVDLFLQNELDDGQKNGDNEYTHEGQKVNVENDGCDLQEEVQGDDGEKSNVKRGLVIYDVLFI